MDAHRIEILDGANDDAIVLVVAHHFHLEFFPANNRFLDKQFVRRRSIQPALADSQKFFLVVSDTAAGSAECERWPDDGREPNHGLHLQRLFDTMSDGRTRTGKANTGHRLFELLTILCLVDGLPGGAY